MKILTIVGARPQFVKAAMVSRAFRKHPRVCEFILHTGQHYDSGMSDVFFKELRIPNPYKNLEVGSAPHGKQTAAMIAGIEKECFKLKPDWILSYGDTNSTLASALVAAKLMIPHAHVEAGLRSFNRGMPEEINRIVADRLSDLLFAPTQTAVQNLRNEGIQQKVRRVGDVMIDAIYYYRNHSRQLPRSRVREIVPSTSYFVLTLHRQENTDDLRRFRSIMRGLTKSKIPFVFPVHPRTTRILKESGISLPSNIQPIPPVTYLEMILLQDRSMGVWTDSGGMQKESVVLGKPCFTLRDETEWVETVECGWNELVGADSRKIEKALQNVIWGMPRKKFPVRRLYGDGLASHRIVKILLSRSRHSSH